MLEYCSSRRNSWSFFAYSALRCLPIQNRQPHLRRRWSLWAFLPSTCLWRVRRLRPYLSRNTFKLAWSPAKGKLDHRVSCDTNTSGRRQTLMLTFRDVAIGGKAKWSWAAVSLKLYSKDHLSDSALLLPVLLAAWGSVCLLLQEQTLALKSSVINWTGRTPEIYKPASISMSTVCSASMLTAPFCRKWYWIIFRFKLGFSLQRCNEERNVSFRSSKLAVPHPLKISIVWNGSCVVFPHSLGISRR